MKKFLLQFAGIISGLFLIITGLILLLLYRCFYSTAPNAFISLWMFLFFLCLGIIAVIYGIRRIYLTIKGDKKIE